MGKVYPRVCGGTPASLSPPVSQQGLSPRVRGNPMRSNRTGQRPGSIPACAGEPETNLPPDQATRVYPRVCGGTLMRQVLLYRFRGLSPRVRGNHAGGDALEDHPGSIPACAGEPHARSYANTESKVYPRVCGGTDAGLEGTFFHIGLSPRVRGNLTPRPER